MVRRSAAPGAADAGEVDEAVRERVGAEQPLYVLDDLLRGTARPDPDPGPVPGLRRAGGQVEDALDEIGVPDAKVVRSIATPWTR